MRIHGLQVQRTQLGKAYHFLTRTKKGTIRTGPLIAREGIDQATMAELLDRLYGLHGAKVSSRGDASKRMRPDD